MFLILDIHIICYTYAVAWNLLDNLKGFRVIFWNISLRFFSVWKQCCPVDLDCGVGGIKCDFPVALYVFGS